MRGTSPPCTNGAHISAKPNLYAKHFVSPKCCVSFRTRVTSNTFHSGDTGAVHAIPQTQTHSLTRNCDGAVSGKFNARDVTKVGREGVKVRASVDVPDNKVVVARSGDHLTLVRYGNGDAGDCVCVTYQYLESNCDEEITEAGLVITWDSFPPATCHTFNDMSREPVMTY